MISLILPVYNVEEYIKECLESILCQTYKDYQLIVVDDGSTDKSLDIVYSFEKKFKNINILK
ncbi:glycosyltransferase family 2 protein, partial [Clostridium butyricum]